MNGIDNFGRYILFDETELLSNTNEVEFSLTNRIFTKQKDGRVEDTLSWTVAHRRFFDPTFGGAIVEGSAQCAAQFSHADGLHLSGCGAALLADILRAPGAGFAGVSLEWRADYDPARGHMTNSSLTGDRRFKNNVYLVDRSQPGA